MNVILISDSPVLADACRETLQSTLRVKVVASVVCRDRLSAEALEQEIDGVAAALSELAPQQLRRCAGIAATQFKFWPDLDPLQKDAGLGALVGELVLAFPELHWLVVGPAKKHSQDDDPSQGESNGRAPESNLASVTELLARVAKLAATEHSSAPALFDRSGLRNLVKQKTLRRSVAEGGEPFADRRECAVAIDDEAAYAYFHALAAYRFGYRAAVVTSARAMKDLLGDAAREWSLVFEDLYLNFADREEAFEEEGFKREIDAAKRDGEVFHLSDLSRRDAVCPGLLRSTARVLVTAGHARGVEGRAIWRKNLEYLRARGVRFRVVIKPTAGLFRLRHEAGLAHRQGERAGPAGAFRWPPRGDAADDGRLGSNHSAPGRLLKIAERLLARGRAILSNADGVEDAVHAAVLAIDAKELLANRTPTTSLEAVALQHEAEVTAESLFVGVEYNLDLKARFRDVEHEVKAVVAWFNRRRRKRSALNARLLVVEKLAERLGNLNQVEEEAKCLAAATKLRFDFWVRERPWRWVLWPFLRYLSLVSSLPRLALAVSIWILLFTGAHLIIGNPHGLPFGSRLVLDAVSSSAYSFAALQPAQAWQDVFRGLGPQCLFAFESVVAWLNLGLLVSHLYAIISRR
jgi:hypothetical protein